MNAFRVAYLRILFGILSVIFPVVCGAVIVGEFPGFTFPMNLTADVNGNVWFTSADSMLRRITPEGVVTAFPLPPGRSFVYVGGIVAGPDGNIWFASSRIIRATPSGAMTEFELPTADVPVAMTVGPDGNIWFTTGGGGPIGRITMSGFITTFYLGTSFNHSPTVSSIAAGPDGNLWFTTSDYGGIGRITTGGTVTRIQETATASDSYWGITPGPDGNMWFADYGNNRIGRITPAGAVTFFSVPSIRRGMSNITTGPDGDIWFQQEGSPGNFGVLTPSGVLSELSLLPAQDEAFGLPTNFTTSPDGLIWFNRYLSGKISFISLANISNFFPLSSGATWSYSASGGTSSVTRTVVPGTTIINGANTTQLSDSDGSSLYVTNDANGIREHQQVEFLDNITFSPPITHVSATGILGSAAFSSGTASGTISGQPFSVPYNNSSLIQALDTVTVPAGTFRAARLQSSLSLPGGTVTETDWFADGVGLLKGIADGESFVLTSTNLVVTKPDIFSYVSPTAAPPITQNTFTVTGTTAASPVSITGGEYSINGGPYTTAPGSVSNGQSIAVRPLAFVNLLVKQAVVTIGGVSGVFNTLVPPVPSVNLSAASLAFGDQAVATTSAAQQVTLTNGGNATLNISGILAVGDFAGANTCGTTLAAGAACAISVTFTPTTSGAHSGQLSISSDAAGSPHYVTLTGTGVLPDTQAPTIPTGVTAIAVSGSQINLAWSASTDNVGVVQYRIAECVLSTFESDPLCIINDTSPATVNAPNTAYSRTGLSPSSTYLFFVQACDAAGNCSGLTSSVASATTLVAGQYLFEPKLEQGFNLISNALNVTLDVAVIFGNQDAQVAGVTPNIVSIWKWNAADGRWAFYSPQLTIAGNTSYAASKNYEVLSTINPGEGYWVNSTVPLTLPPQSGTGFNWNGFSFAALPSGFNLITTAEGYTPSQFNVQVSAAPPVPGVVPTDNFVSLWTWDAVTATWYFYSPLLEASGGLAAVKNYADSHFFRHFQDYGKLIGLGVGFWVNRP